MKVPAHLAIKVSRNYYNWLDIQEKYQTWQDIKDNFNNWEEVLLFSPFEGEVAQ